MEGAGDVNFDAVAMGRTSRDDDYESRSGSENLDGIGSGDEMENQIGSSSRSKKKYHRHTPYQIQELEAYVLYHFILFFSYFVWIVSEIFYLTVLLRRIHTLMRKQDLNLVRDYHWKAGR